MEMEQEKLSQLFDALGPQLFDVLDKAPEQIQQCAFAGLVFMGSMYLSYTKQRRVQEDQRRQNEDIKDIRQTLANLQKQQTESIQKERREWEKKETQYETERKNLQADAAHKEEQIQKLKDELSEKEQECQVLTQQREHREAEMAAQYKAYQTEIEEQYQEIQEHWILYHQYKQWISENFSKIPLNLLETSSFEVFIACCSKSGVFKYIFDRIEISNIWDWDKADIKILDRVIDCCIALQGNKFTRVETHNVYDPMQHRKWKDASPSGRITDVLLRGVAENGLILESCKSYVKLESE